MHSSQRIAHSETILAALCCLTLAAGCRRVAPTPSGIAARPFFDLRSYEPNYAGPGRELSDPAGAKEVLIGYFGPASGSHPLAGDMWLAACMAIEQANSAGGYKGLPFRLVSAWSDNPWGSGVKELTRLIFEENVWAVIGGVDGPTTHLAEQIVVKAGVPLLSPVATDKTVNLTNVAWIFSFTPHDPLQAGCLADGLRSRLGVRSFVLISATDHDSHAFTVELQRRMTAEYPACAFHYEFNPAGADLASLVRRMDLAGQGAVVIVAAAVPGARLVRSLRESGYEGTLFGGPCMAQQTFLATAGPAAAAVLFPCSYVPSDRSTAFEEAFAQRYGVRPDTLASHTYDAVNMLIAATRSAGLSRTRIRDAVRAMSPWQGVTGTIQWDPPGANPAPVTLCTIRSGRRVRAHPLNGQPALRSLR